MCAVSFPAGRLAIWAVTLVLPLALVACSPDLRRNTCTGDQDCTPTERCNTSLSLCEPVDRDVTAADVAADTSEARDGGSDSGTDTADLVEDQLDLDATTDLGGSDADTTGSDTGNIGDDAPDAPVGYQISGRVYGVTTGSVELTLNDEHEVAIRADGDSTFTFATRLPPGTPYRIEVTVQPPARECTVPNGRGVMGNADITNLRVLCTGAAQPRYDQSLVWSRYIDPAQLPLMVPCTSESTGWNKGPQGCLHAGELFQVEVLEVDDCYGIEARDGLNAFSWECEASSGEVVVYSTGLRPGSRVLDLIDYSGEPKWRENNVTVFLRGALWMTTHSSVWHTNTLLVVNTVSGNFLNIPETVYIVTEDPGNELMIDFDEVTVTTVPGVHFGGALAEDDNFLWIEGDVELTEEDGSTLQMVNVAHSRFHMLDLLYISITDEAPGLHLQSESHSNLITELTSYAPENDVFAGLVIEGNFNHLHNTASLDLDVHIDGSVGNRITESEIRLVGTFSRRPPTRLHIEDSEIHLNSTIHGGGHRLHAVLFHDGLHLGSGLTGESLVSDVRLFHETGTSSFHDTAATNVQLTYGSLELSGVSSIFGLVAAGATGVGSTSVGDEITVAFATLANMPGDGLKLTQGAVAHVLNTVIVNTMTDGLHIGTTLPVDDLLVRDVIVSHSPCGVRANGVLSQATAPETIAVSGLRVVQSVGIDCAVSCLVNDGSCPDGWNTAFDIGDTFVGVATTDRFNPEVVAGTTSANQITDRTTFANRYRLWLAAADDYLDIAANEVCTDECNLYDWSVRPEDDVLWFASELGEGYPTGTDAYFFGVSGAPTLFNAIEHPALNDLRSNDGDGRCESGEGCVWAPHIGAFQGWGHPVPCDGFEFDIGMGEDGAPQVTGVDLYCLDDRFTVRELTDPRLVMRPPAGTLVQLDEVLVTAVIPTEFGAGGFYVRDPDGGEYSGMLIATGADEALVATDDPVARGMRVRVSGTLAFHEGLDQLELITIELLDRGQPDDAFPELLDLDKAVSGTDRAPWAGRLVRVHGVTTINFLDPPFRDEGNSDEFFIAANDVPLGDSLCGNDGGQCICNDAGERCVLVTDRLYDDEDPDNNLPDSAESRQYVSITGIVGADNSSGWLTIQVLSDGDLVPE